MKDDDQIIISRLFRGKSISWHSEAKFPIYAGFLGIVLLQHTMRINLMPGWSSRGRMQHHPPRGISVARGCVRHKTPVIRAAAQVDFCPTELRPWYRYCTPRQMGTLLPGSGSGGAKRQQWAPVPTTSVLFRTQSLTTAIPPTVQCYILHHPN